MNCIACNTPAVIYDGATVDPPLCPVHLDLAVLVEFLRSRGEPVTEENVLRLLARGRANSDQWTLVAEQVPELLPAWLVRDAQRAAAQQNSRRTPEHAGQIRTTPAQEVSQ